MTFGLISGAFPILVNADILFTPSATDCSLISLSGDNGPRNAYIFSPSLQYVSQRLPVSGSFSSASSLCVYQPGFRYFGVRLNNSDNPTLGVGLVSSMSPGIYTVLFTTVGLTKASASTLSIAQSNACGGAGDPGCYTSTFSILQPVDVRQVIYGPDVANVMFSSNLVGLREILFDVLIKVVLAVIGLLGIGFGILKIIEYIYGFSSLSSHQE